jgi:hypothetical protein
MKLFPVPLEGVRQFWASFTLVRQLSAPDSLASDEFLQLLGISGPLHINS